MGSTCKDVPEKTLQRLPIHVDIPSTTSIQSTKRFKNLQLE
jgi:hypothetical protein